MSNFGRVRSLPKYREVVIPKRGVITYWTKELILKQNKQKFKNAYLKEYSFCLTVALFQDGSYSTFTVPRLVYAHFGPAKVNLTKETLILHKDNDSLYNHIDNLYAADHTEMHKVAYKLKRKVSYFTNLNTKTRQSYTSLAIANNIKPVTQYNMVGKRVKQYKSIVEASDKTGIKVTSIINAIAGRYLTAGGYIWRAGKGKAVIDVTKVQKRIGERYRRRCKAIRQYSISGKKIAEFPSMKVAAESVNGSVRQLYDAVNGRSKTAYGFKWKFVAMM